MEGPVKYNKCPHCKSNKGYKITIRLGGYQDEVRTFTGKIISINREGIDDKDRMVECANCGKPIPLENVKHD